jgi:transcriptional regulator with XRE-family HTH domain
MNTFGELLRGARIAAGLSQAELAARASTKTSVHHSYVSTIERGTSPPPSREVITALLDALEITDKAERAAFYLSANCAGLQDLEGIEPETHEPSEEASMLYTSSLVISQRYIMQQRLAAVEKKLQDIAAQVQATIEEVQDIKAYHEEAYNEEED